ncbi:MFS transporter [Actinomycetospora cinnamomea]|uniref:Putative MFS family arabinose efflux permease n=1 Tax=Actinomycetospora cinnamomea TaxID=663609 RepID=A0A2U1FLN3_9PSEU|nr:MFS transporter [Actinomycetospora cinnamomea]PVZ13125.1 putative MFS family arabinose efflux permease [Actinomycetospora cinnamomea]
MEPTRGAGTRAEPSTARRVAFVVVAYSFVVTMLGTTLPTPLYPIYQERYGYSGLLVTVIFAAYAVGVIAALLLLGRLSDQIGRRPVLLLGLGLSALSAVAFLAPLPAPLDLPGLFVGRVLSGLSAGVYTGTATATLLDLVPDEGRARASLVGAAVNMGGLGLGPVVAGVLAQYAPAPLALPYVASLLLLVPAAVGVALIPEPVPGAGGWRGASLRPQRLRVPAAARPVFVRAVIAGFAGFAVLGLFTSVSPSFLGEVLDIRDHAVEGLVVFSLLAASTVGQLASARLGERTSLVGGSAVLGVGALGIALALLLASLPVLVAAAVVAGLGQGASFRAGLGAVGAASPAEQRAEVSSSFFVVVYVALSVPVIGVGAAAQGFGLTTAGVVFSVAVAVLAAVAVGALLRRTDHQGSDAIPSD